jgi:hypothetical protein
MEIEVRLIKVSYVLLALLFVVLAMAFISYFVAVGTVIAFSAYTGAEAKAFLLSLKPTLHFFAGLAGGGGLVALLNALISPTHFRLKLILLGSFSGAIMALLYAPLGESLASLGVPFFNAISYALVGK